MLRLRLRAVIVVALFVASLTSCVGKEIEEMRTKIERQDARFAEMEVKQRKLDKLVAAMVASAEKIEVMARKVAEVLAGGGGR